MNKSQDFITFVIQLYKMAYSKNDREIHSMIAEYYDRYHTRGFISFRKTPEVKGTQYLDPIIHAIEQKQVLRLFYLPYYEDKPYFSEVHPYLLKEHGFRWYLVGMNAFRKQLRTYALDRIRDLQDAPGVRYQEPAFNIRDYFKHSVGIIAPQGDPPLIKLAVQKTQAQYLISQPWHESQNIVKEDDEQIIFSFRVHPTYEFRSLVLGLGKDAEVIGPVTLKQEIKTEITAMLERYGE